MNNNWQGHNQKTLSNSIGTSSKTNTTNNHNSYKLHQTKNSSNVIYDSISEHKISNQDKKVHLSMKFSVLPTSKRYSLPTYAKPVPNSVKKWVMLFSNASLRIRSFYG